MSLWANAELAMVASAINATTIRIDANSVARDFALMALSLVLLLFSTVVARVERSLGIATPALAADRDQGSRARSADTLGASPRVGLTVLAQPSGPRSPGTARSASLGLTLLHRGPRAGRSIWRWPTGRMFVVASRRPKLKGSERGCNKGIHVYESDSSLRVYL